MLPLLLLLLCEGCSAGTWGCGCWPWRGGGCDGGHTLGVAALGLAGALHPEGCVGGKKGTIVLCALLCVVGGAGDKRAVSAACGDGVLAVVAGLRGLCTLPGPKDARPVENGGCVSEVL